MERFKVVFYEKEDGSRPAYDFILSLSEKMRAKIYKTASLLEVEGAKARMPYSEYLSDGIFRFALNRKGIFPAFCISLQSVI